MKRIISLDYSLIIRGYHLQWRIFRHLLYLTVQKNSDFFTVPNLVGLPNVVSLREVCGVGGIISTCSRSTRKCSLTFATFLSLIQNHWTGNVGPGTFSCVQYDALKFMCSFCDFLLFQSICPGGTLAAPLDGAHTFLLSLSTLHVKQEQCCFVWSNKSSLKWWCRNF